MQPFVRLENERNSPGNGLGLNLVKAVAGIHNAKLELGDAGPGLKASITFTQKTRRAREASVQ